MNLAFRAHSSTLNGMACALCHCSAIFTTLHKVYVRLGLFTQAGKVLNTAQHKGLLDISDTDKSQPFEIRILDNSTLRASASLTHFLLNVTCCYSCRTDWQRNLQSPRTHCAACAELKTQQHTFKPFVMSALQVQSIMVSVALITSNIKCLGTKNIC